MDSSQAPSDKPNSTSLDLTRYKFPIVIFLDSQSQHSKQNHQIVHDQANQETQKDLFEDKSQNKQKTKISKRRKKHKNLQSQIYQIQDDDNQNVGNHRKSLRISKKERKNYKPFYKIKRQNPDLQRRNRKKELQNTVPPFIIATANPEGNVSISLNKYINEQKNVETMEKQSEPRFDNIFPPIQFKTDDIREPNMVEQNSQNRDKRDMKFQEEDYEIEFEIQNEKQVTTNNRQHQDLNLRQKQDLQDSKPSEINLKPSGKFQKQFLDTNTVQDRRAAIINILFTKKSLKPQKYLNQIQSNFQNHKQFEPKEFSLASNQLNSENEQKKVINQIPIITIDSSDDEEKIQIASNVQSSEKPIELSPNIRLMIQKIEPEQNEQFYYLSQNLKIFYAEPPHQQKTHNQNVANLNLPSEVLPATDIIQEIQNIEFMQPEQKDFNQQLPAQKYVKSKLGKKITKRKIFYSSASQLSEKWQNSEYVAVEEEYPFYLQEQKPTCNLFTDKLHLILSIKKCEYSQNLCTVFYQSQMSQKYQFSENDNMESQSQSQIRKVPTEKQKSIKNRRKVSSEPQNIELDKIRLLYPQKLIDFYQMAAMVYSKKIQAIEETDTVYDLSERTQDMIKHRYR